MQLFVYLWSNTSNYLCFVFCLSWSYPRVRLHPVKVGAKIYPVAKRTTIGFLEDCFTNVARMWLCLLLWALLRTQPTAIFKIYFKVLCKSLQDFTYYFVHYVNHNSFRTIPIKQTVKPMYASSSGSRFKASSLRRG